MTAQPTASVARLPGGTVFAAVILSLAGLLSILQGITAIAHDNLYVVGVHYVYRFNLTSWGWIHLVVGVLLVLTGLGLFAGQAWARWVGVLFASVSLALQFMFIPYFPAWAFVAIALDAVVLWALLVHAGEQHA